MSGDPLGILKRQPLRVVCALLALVSGVGVYVVNGRIETSRAELDQKAAEGARLATNVSYAAQLPEQFASLSDVGKQVRARSVRAGELATNLQYFYRLETESGVELIDLRQTTSGNAGKAKNASAGVGFSVSVKGDYLTLLGWLRRVETGPHYARILSAAMGGVSPDRAGPLSLSVTLELLGEP